MRRNVVASLRDSARTIGLDTLQGILLTIRSHYTLHCIIQKSTVILTSPSSGTGPAMTGTIATTPARAEPTTTTRFEHFFGSMHFKNIDFTIFLWAPLKILTFDNLPNQREAEAEANPTAVAEPEADADAFYGYYGHGLGYTYGHGHGYTYGNGLGYSYGHPLAYAHGAYGHGLGYGLGYVY